MFHIWRLEEVSIPEVGSSNIINFEFPIKAIPVYKRLHCPPDRFLEY